ncbi:hypothetical protein GCM10022407_21390 [Hymenobacter antarcticus]|uniref:Por secretion system C-terminal sorting domain-containing protein n=1 Tax=Hymenobacter antarcticus TaxID=486270 RepID=A0ABP7Q3G2_9BACT
MGALALLGSTLGAIAEGSKQLTPNTNPGAALTDPANTRAGFLTHDVVTDNASLGFLKPATWTGTGGIPFSEDYRMYVHIEPNEVLYYGVRRNSRPESTTAQADLTLTLRYGVGAGTVVQTTTLARDQASTNQSLLLPGAGVITTAQQAQAGPLPTAGGYAPLTYTNTTGSAQEFYIEFTQVGESGLTDNAKRSEYDFWDFTVRTNAGVEKPGRLYSKHWAFSAGTSSGPAGAIQNRLSATFNLYPLVESKKTPGQYFVKQVELAGMRPLVFYFVSNEFGSTYDATTRTTVADRQKSQTSRTSYPQYANFVNEPDAAIYPSAATPTVSTSAAAFCQAGVTKVAFTTRSDETGSFDILIDLNGNNVNDGVDRLLQQFVAGGSFNTIVWDGKDKNGATVTPTGQVIKYNFVSRGATVNFPVYDAEGNPDGFRIRNTRPNTAAYDLLYWDDSRLTNFTTKGVELTGVDSTPGVHLWGVSTDQGNTYTVNSWTYGFTVFQGAKTFTYATACDNDKDGVDDLVDIDDDNDGVLDAVEGFSPTGVAAGNANYVDPSAFAAGAAVPYYLDVNYVHPVLGVFLDTNGDGVNDLFDIDRDGIPNHNDLDADGDGLTDAFEANGNTVPNQTFGPVTVTAGGNTYTYQSLFDVAQGRFVTTAVARATAAGTSAGVGPNGLPDAIETSVSYAKSGNNVVATETDVSGYTLTDSDSDQRTSGTATSKNYNFLDIDSDNDGITDDREAQTTAGYIAPSGTDTDKDGLDNSYDPTPGGTVTAGAALTTLTNSDTDATADIFDTDSDNDNASRAALPIYRQTADWTEGFDVSGNGLAGDEIVAKARAFAAANPEKFKYYEIAGPFGSTSVSDFLLVSKTVNGDKIPAFLDPASFYYHDDNFNGLVDLYDPAYGGSPSMAPKRVATQPEADYRTSSVQTPLPVELTAFTATAVKNVDTQLAWNTASEKNNDYFNVERSLNGTDFVKIGQVIGQGSKSAPTDYALTDTGIGAKVSSTVYYRLQQVDTDGTATYSPVRTAAFVKALASAPAITLFPNPGKMTSTLDLTQLPTGTYQVSLLDATGRVVMNTTLSAGLTHVLTLNSLANGTYTVLVRGQNGSEIVNLTKRLIKE